MHPPLQADSTAQGCARNRDVCPRAAPARARLVWCSRVKITDHRTVAKTSDVGRVESKNFGRSSTEPFP